MKLIVPFIIKDIRNGVHGNSNVKTTTRKNYKVEAENHHPSIFSNVQLKTTRSYTASLRIFILAEFLWICVQDCRKSSVMPLQPSAKNYERKSQTWQNNFLAILVARILYLLAKTRKYWIFRVSESLSQERDMSAIFTFLEQIDNH